MAGLSYKAQDLLTYLKEEYKEYGYFYSGSCLFADLLCMGYSDKVIKELQTAGLVRRRNCSSCVYELSQSEKAALLSNYSLCSVWYHDIGSAGLSEIRKEVQNVADIPVDRDTGKITVSLCQNIGDEGGSDKTQTFCQLSVGQVISLDYNFPPKMRSIGKTHVGQFMVTNIVHNTMVAPPRNMLEVQSLCEEFNKLYPQKRTMMLFEDDLLNRMKQLDTTLEQKLESAGERSRQAEANSDVRILNFVDEVGYTQFSVDAGWYEKQENKEDVAGLFEKASFDEESGFKDLTGKYYEAPCGRE